MGITSKLYRVGTNNFKCAVLIEDAKYYLAMATQYNGITDMTALATVLGTDINPLIDQHRTEDIPLITFKDGSVLYAYATTFNTSNSYWDAITKTSYNINFKYKNASGAIITGYGGTVALSIKLNSTGVTYPIPLYLAISLDDIAKTAQFVLYTKMDNPAYYTGVVYISPQTDYYWGASKFYQIFTGNGSEYDPDPWSNGGYADIGGGDGEVNLTSDPINLPSIPTAFSATGLIQLYCPSLSQVQELSNYMWSSSFIDSLVKLVMNPMDIIISLSMIPYPVTPTGNRQVYAGNVVTMINMNYTDQQYIIIECGSIEVKPFYKSYIDYEPYTTCEIFLPYIGYQKLSMDEIMGKIVKVTYRVDLLTGLCSAFITCNDILLYTFGGSCASTIPVSSQSYNTLAQSVINIATTTALAIPPSKSGAPAANPNYYGQTQQYAASSSLASNVLSCKPDIQRSGCVSSNLGILGAQKPYLVFSVPKVCLPKGQNKYLGYPAFMSAVLSTLTGFTVIEEIRLDNMTCTEDEKEEIMKLLKGGVIL